LTFGGRLCGAGFAGGRLAGGLCRRSRGGLLLAIADGCTTDHALRLIDNDVVLIGQPDSFVLFLDQQPLFLVATAAQMGAYQRPVAGELFADQRKLELAVLVSLSGVTMGLP